jgi:hypothetical protein
MPAARKRFFISYSRVDKDLVEPVVALLRTAPTDVFLDLDSIEPGDIWTDRLERAIKGASSFVIFWCDHSANSSWVRKEWTFAVGNKKRIIPVFLDSTGLPDELKTFQGINFRPFAHGLHLSLPPEQAEMPMPPTAAESMMRRATPVSPRHRIAPFGVAILLAALAIAGFAVFKFVQASPLMHAAFKVVQDTLTGSIGKTILIMILLILTALSFGRFSKKRGGPRKGALPRRVPCAPPPARVRPGDKDIRLMAELLRERLQEEAAIPDES